MDSLLGKGAIDEDMEYDPEVEGSINLVFSTSAYRLHTFVSGAFHLRDENGKLVQNLRLRDVFHAPMTLLVDDTFDQLIRGHASQSLQEFNIVYTPEMTEWLFAESNNHDFGLDIVSLNVQRGRDHQIQGYTFYKQLCDLGTTLDWEDLANLIPEHLVHRLFHTYESPDDVDLYIAQVMESPKNNSLLGPTAHCLIKKQFNALKKGDRFFYTNKDQFSPDQCKEIKKQSLTSVICANADEPTKLKLSPNLFQKAEENELKPCSEYPEMDLSGWS